MGDAAHLRIVDAEGELLPSCPGCADLNDQLDGAHKEIRAWRTRYANLKRDKEQDARESVLWPQAIEAFRYWQEECGHLRSKFTADRFFLLEPYLLTDGLAVVKLAIAGAAFNPYRADRPNRNGRLEVYDSLETIFKNRAAFERHCNRAPIEVQRETELPGLDHDALRLRAEVILTLMPEDGRPMHERVDEAVEQARKELAA